MGIGACLPRESIVPGARSGSQVAWFRVYWLGISLVSSRLVGASGQVVYASSSKGCSYQLLHYPAIRDSSRDRLSYA